MHKNFIVENLGFRLGEYHPECNIQIGRGNTDAGIVVVQPRQKMPDRDAVTGALKKFGMLDDAYRATSKIVDFSNAPTIRNLETRVEYPDLIRQNRRGCNGKPKTGDEMNRAYLLELIEIIRPLIVVACGAEVTSLLADRNIRSFSAHAGKRFSVKDLTSCTFCAILDPVEYGFDRAPRSLKDQGKAEWTKVAALYNSMKDKRERERWAC